MALSFTVSYTFSPSTTISSSQVNTNTSDVALVFQGLEAKTKSFSNLKVDATPASATEVAIKSYVDSFMTWRRPVLKYASATTVTVESGLDGTSGDIPMLFPDGSYRTETSTTRTTFDITRNAVLTTSGAQSGLTGATSEATNTWYALYACKVTDSTTQWCTVGTTVLPTQANYATLNAAYGTSGWVYLGTIRNGDQGGTTGDILDFTMCGNVTKFNNIVSSGNSGRKAVGVLMATTAGATSLTYSVSTGTSGATIPSHLTLIYWGASETGGASHSVTVSYSGGTDRVFFDQDSLTAFTVSLPPIPSGNGIKIANSGAISTVADITLQGFVDPVLGVGSNPLL